MAEITTISWADATFNPWIGCTNVSPGCDHCYAEALDHRWGHDRWGPGKPRQRTSAANWKQPLAWNRKAQESGQPWRVFCASLADVFDNEVPDEWRTDLWALIAATPALTWMLLTKRIGNVTYPMPSNVWLGITVVNQAEADRDIPKLLAIPATKRFLSCEPLLGPITVFDAFSSWCPICHAIVGDSLAKPHESVHGVSVFEEFDETKHCIDVPAMLDWVIVGGESGHGARPMHPGWARAIRDQCAAAEVPFHFKQNGEWVSVSEVAGAGPHFQFPDGATVRRLGVKKSGHTLDGREHLEFPR